MSFTLSPPNVASPPNSARQPTSEGLRHGGGYLRHKDNSRKYTWETGRWKLAASRRCARTTLRQTNRCHTKYAQGLPAGQEWPLPSLSGNTRIGSIWLRRSSRSHATSSLSCTTSRFCSATTPWKQTRRKGLRVPLIHRSSFLGMIDRGSPINRHSSQAGASQRYNIRPMERSAGGGIHQEP